MSYNKYEAIIVLVFMRVGKMNAKHFARTQQNSTFCLSLDVYLIFLGQQGTLPVTLLFNIDEYILSFGLESNYEISENSITEIVY